MQVNIVEYIVKHQEVKVLYTRKFLRESKKVNTISIFKKKEREILAGLRHKAKRVSELNHQNDQFAITQEHNRQGSNQQGF